MVAYLFNPEHNLFKQSGIVYLTDMSKEIVNVNVISHLLSAAYKLTSGPLHVSLGMPVKNCLTLSTPYNTQKSACSARYGQAGMHRGIKKSCASFTLCYLLYDVSDALHSSSHFFVCYFLLPSYAQDSSAAFHLQMPVIYPCPV